MMRQRVELNGTWSCKPVAWTMIQKDGTVRQLDKALPDIDSMEIPMNWHLGGLPDFFGTVEFSRKFIHEPEAGRNTFLCFDGVDYRCKVYVNGRLAGSHEGCFQRFEFDITDKLNRGENTLLVAVESPNEEPEEVWPHRKWLIKGILSHWDAKPGGWDLERGQDGNTGGIWGDVYLESRAPFYITETKFHTQILPKKTPDEVFIIHWDDKKKIDATPKAYVWTKVKLSEPAAAERNVKIKVTLTDEDGRVSSHVYDYEGAGEHIGMFHIDQPKLWWPWDMGNPHLYDVNIQLLEGDRLHDEISFTTGLREIEFEKATGTWTINGKRQFVRGTNVIPTLWLGEYTEEKISRDIGLLREANINGVRVCVHVNRKEWYDACDRAGILVWQDFMLQWGYANETKVIESAAKQIKDMIRQHYNHPSIGIWCCQNESLFFNNEVVGPQLAKAAKEEDSSRHVHETSEFHEHPYSGWYSGHYKQYDMLPGGRLITEFGAQALPSLEETLELNGSEAWPPNWDRLGYHNFQYDQTFYRANVEHNDNWEDFVKNSQDYQARLLRTGLEAFRRSRFGKVGSMFQFMFMDAWPAITWSVVSHKRIPKKGYHILKQAYQPVLAGAGTRESWPAKQQFGGGEEYMAFNPWIINDYHRKYEDCKLVVEFAKVDGSFARTLSEQTFLLPADSRMNLETVRFKHFNTFEPGEYEFIFTVIHENETLSVNRYPAVID